jgi:hypothetical protein
LKRITPYLKMRVLGAIEFAPGNTVVDRIKHVSTLYFTDENDQRFRFTWRTIQTWYSRYKKDGITTMHPRTRTDKGATRKVPPEALAEAIDQVLPTFRGNPSNVTAVYRTCIERGLLLREQVAPNTFRRHVKAFNLLKPDAESSDKRRLAFAKAHANEMWQADTMFGPYVQNGANKTQTKLIAFIDDASRVCCHAEFFLAENTDTLIQALRSALYKRGVPHAMYVGRVDHWRGGFRLPVAMQTLSNRRLIPACRDSVSSGLSSNRTCRSPASGSHHALKPSRSTDCTRAPSACRGQASHRDTCPDTGDTRCLASCSSASATF